MDAFSLAVSIGTMSISKLKTLILSSIVGIFHFIMPLIGSFVGLAFLSKFKLNINFLSGVIFFYIGIQMFKEFKEENSNKINLNLLGMIIFAIGVSLDSFGVGMTFNCTFEKKIIYSLIFSIFSAFFTLLGLILGKFINKLIGDYAIVLGSFIMCILAIINFCQFLGF